MSDYEPDGRDLWRRYGAALSSLPAPGEPDAALLAAWMEGRLDEAAAAPVEAWLARHPEALALVVPVADAVAAPAPLDLVRRARALVPSGAAPGRGQPGAVPARAMAGWRLSMAWGSIAASLLIVAATGFLAGHEAVHHSDMIVASAASDAGFGPGEGDGDGPAF